MTNLPRHRVSFAMERLTCRTTRFTRLCKAFLVMPVTCKQCPAFAVAFVPRRDNVATVAATTDYGTVFYAINDFFTNDFLRCGEIDAHRSAFHKITVLWSRQYVCMYTFPMTGNRMHTAETPAYTKADGRVGRHLRCW